MSDTYTEKPYRKPKKGEHVNVLHDEQLKMLKELCDLLDKDPDVFHYEELKFYKEYLERYV